MAEVELIAGSLPGPEGLSREPSGEERKPRGVAGRRANVEKLRAPLEDKMMEYIGVPIAAASPLAAAVWYDRTSKNVTAILRLAEQNDKFRKSLEKFIEGSAYFDLGLTAIAMAVALLVQFERLSPNSFIAEAFDIDDHWNKLYGEVQENGVGNDGIVLPRGFAA